MPSGSSEERQAAEQQLTQILNRALKAVPLVKLDAVDEVMKLFKEAVTMMESSLELDDEDEQRSQASVAGSAANPSNASLGQNKLLALAGGFPAAPAAAAAPAPVAAEAESESRGTIPPLQNKAIQGVAMTVDYSSPSSKTRSLGSKGGAKSSEPAAGGSSRASGGSGLGLGLGKSSGGGSAAPAAKQPVLGLGHKMSSRATTSLTALANNPANGQGNSPVSPTTESSSADATNSPAAGGSDQGATTPTGSSAAAGSSEPPAGLQAKNKLVAKIAGAPQKEFPSPKLGPRSLSTAPPRNAQPAPAAPSPSNAAATAAANPAAAGLSLPQADSLGRDAPAAQMGASGLASPDADDEPDDESETGDLIRTDKKNSVFNRVKSTLPVTASPKQIRSSFHLLELATTHSLLQADQEEDLTQKQQGGGIAANGAAGGNGPASGGVHSVLSALPTGITQQGTGSTPKPAFLRRLDSPETHHGQLIAAKAQLQMLINQGLQMTDKVRLERVPEIKAALEKALAKLEANLVTSSQM